MTASKFQPEAPVRTNYLASFDARRPMDNPAAYRADRGKQLEADDNADRRDTFAPFEGSRKPSAESNDTPNTGVGVN